MNVRYQSESIDIKMKFLTYYEQNAIYFSVVTSMDFLSYPFTNTLTRHCLYSAFNNPYSYVVTSLPYLRLVCILFLCQSSARYCSVYVNSASNSFNQSFLLYSPIIYLSATYTLSLISLFVCYSNNRRRIRSYPARNCSPCVNQVSTLTYHISILVHSQPEAVVPAVGGQIVLLNVVQVTLPDHTPVVVIIITGVVREITKGNWFRKS